MNHNLDVVTCRINHEGTVVAWMIVFSDSRCAIVFATGFESRSVEVVDLFAVCGGMLVRKIIGLTGACGSFLNRDNAAKKPHTQR